MIDCNSTFPSFTVKSKDERLSKSTKVNFII